MDSGLLALLRGTFLPGAFAVEVTFTIRGVGALAAVELGPLATAVRTPLNTRNRH